MHMACRNAAKDTEEGLAGKGPDSRVCSSTLFTLQSSGGPEGSIANELPDDTQATSLCPQGPPYFTTGFQQHLDIGITWASLGKQSNWIHDRKHQHPCFLHIHWEILMWGMRGETSPLFQIFLSNQLTSLHREFFLHITPPLKVPSPSRSKVSKELLS